MVMRQYEKKWVLEVTGCMHGQKKINKIFPELKLPLRTCDENSNKWPNRLLIKTHELFYQVSKIYLIVVAAMNTIIKKWFSKSVFTGWTTKWIIKSAEVGEFLHRSARLETAQDRWCCTRSHEVLQVDGQGRVDSPRRSAITNSSRLHNVRHYAPSRLRCGFMFSHPTVHLYRAAWSSCLETFSRTCWRLLRRPLFLPRHRWFHRLRNRWLWSTRLYNMQINFQGPIYLRERLNRLKFGFLVGSDFIDKFNPKLPVEFTQFLKRTFNNLCS